MTEKRIIMKKVKILLPLSIIPLILTSCDSKPFITISFLNYKGYDVTEVEYDKQLSGANTGLGLATLDYENNSYSDVIRKITTTTKTAEYTNSKDKETQDYQNEYSTKYNHSKSLLSIYSFNNIKAETSAGKASVKSESEYVNQVYKKNIVEAYKQQKTYRNMADFSTFPTFASFVRYYMPVNPEFCINKKMRFDEFVLEDVPTKYYVHENVYTSGIEYSDRQLNTSDYERTLSVSAVNQIIVNKNEVTINMQYEIKDVRYNFTSAYRELSGINCNKLITETKVQQVETLKIGGKVSIDSANVGDYSLVDNF